VWRQRSTSIVHYTREKGSEILADAVEGECRSNSTEWNPARRLVRPYGMVFCWPTASRLTPMWYPAHCCKQIPIRLTVLPFRTRSLLKLRGGPGCWGPVRSTEVRELEVVRSRAALSLVPYRKPVPRNSPLRYTYLGVRDCVPRNPDLILAHGKTSRSCLAGPVTPAKELRAMEYPYSYKEASGTLGPDQH